MPDSVSTDYFVAKKRQHRKKVSNVSGKAFEAMEIATQVMRLCYPIRFVNAVHCYYNNIPIEPFLEPQDAEAGRQPEESEHIVVDIYFLFGRQQSVIGSTPESTEDDSFAVEVAFPVGMERTMWCAITRVRWADLAWMRRSSGNPPSPVSQLTGEAFVQNWM